MKSLVRSAFFVLGLHLAAAGAEAKGYRGIAPVTSDRADVERVLGKPDPECGCYLLGNETVRITYSEGPEETWEGGEWNLLEGTVLAVRVEYDRGPCLKSLGVDLDEYDEFSGGCTPDNITYTSEREGITYEVGSGRVGRATYGPSAEQRRRYCSDPGDYVPGRPKQIVRGGSPPVCTGITATATEVAAGDTVGLMANASDPSGDVLTYEWTTTGGRVVGSGSNVAYDTTGLEPGTYTVTAQVDDGFGHVVDCSVTITVE